MPTARDLTKLPVLDAVFHESMRYFCPVPFGTSRTIPKAATLGGKVLPEGTSIMVSPWALHTSTHVWGDDAKRWRPARWLEGRSVNAVKRDTTGAMRWLPFSEGRQNCIGQQIATVRSHLLLVSWTAGLERRWRS